MKYIESEHQREAKYGNLTWRKKNGKIKKQYKILMDPTQGLDKEANKGRAEVWNCSTYQHRIGTINERHTYYKTKINHYNIVVKPDGSESLAPNID